MKTTLALLVGIAAAAGPAGPAGPTAPEPIKAVTAPSRDLTLAFVQAGRIANVLVREGQAVRPNQPLLRMDDAVERLQAKLLKAKADDTTAFQAARLRLVRAENLLKKIEKAHSENAGSQRELEDARAEAAMAGLSLEKERLQHERTGLEHGLAQLRLERMRLNSPTAGTVERVLVEAGESVDALVPVIRVIQIDPLWIDVPAAVGAARKLSVGQPALVRFAHGKGDQPALRGKIIRISSLADAASRTLEVRVELPNPARRPAGEQVTVTFPAGGVATPKAPKPARPVSR
jgi:cobalt-zinc-cadmium efflux system membrane fusion protein